MEFDPHTDGILRGDREQSSRRLGDLMRAEARSSTTSTPLSEETLISEFGASRNAIRAALGALQKQGVVSRRRGIGTTINRHWDWSDLAELRGLSESAGAFGGRVTNRVLVADIVSAPLAISASLNLPTRSPVLLIERIRILDGLPFSLDTSYFNAELAHGLLDCALENDDLVALLEDSLGLELGGADLVIESAIAGDALAGQLHVSPGDPILSVDRILRLSDGSVLALEFLRLRGDRAAMTGHSDRGARPRRPTSTTTTDDGNAAYAAPITTESTKEEA
jgi:GntR family transcriptional regulator